MNLTNQNLQRLRTQPHRTNLYLSIFQPRTIMTAVVTGTYSTGDSQIDYINSSGSYLNLYADMTVMVGTTPNSDDIGRIRLRSATGTYAVFAENAINWNNGQYLTILDYVTPEAIYPRIISDPNNAESVIFYKDYDIPYSNQNSIYGTFPCAGSHRAAFIENGTASIYYTATGTYNVAGSSLTYLWAFEGGTPTGSTALTPGNVTYSQTGHYKTKLTVTAANGAVDETYRYVSIYDRLGVGSSTPVQKWELQELSGSRSEGGYTASFKVFDNLGNILPNALVVIFADTWYGSEKVNIGGNAPENSSIIFVGYILSDTIKFNYKESSVEFQVGSISQLMKNTEGFSVSCESKASPATWFELQEMTVPKAMYHYLRWHSTILKIADFQYTGDDRLVQYFDADRGSLYDAVDAFMRDGMLGSVISDRQGKLWAEISSFGYETPLASIPTRFTFHKQDWVGSPTIQERRNTELSFIELGGIAFYGVSTNTFSALLSNAPSTVPLYHGKSDRNDGLILTSQQALNQITGNYLAHHNTKFPNVDLSLAGTYLNLDITPQEKTYLVIDQNDTVRGKSIQDLPYIVDGMTWGYDSRNEVFRPDISLMQIATGTIGVTVEIPAEPPDNGYDYPTLNLPPLPTFPTTPTVGSTIPTIFVMKEATKGVVYTQNFDSGNPQYATMNDGLPNTSITFLFICPNGSLYCGIEGTNTNAFIARSPGVGMPWTVLYDYNSILALYPTDATAGIISPACDISKQESVGWVMGNVSFGFPSKPANIWVGGGGSYAQGASLAGNGIVNLVGKTLFTGGKWAVIAQGGGSNVPHFWQFDSAGSAIVNQGDLPADANWTYVVWGASASDTIAYEARFNSNPGVYRLTSNFSASLYLADDVQNGQGMYCNPEGTLLMGRYQDPARKGRSSDRGTTWTALPNLPPGSNYSFTYAGASDTTSASTSRWVVVSAGGVIRFSPDFGNTWLNKEGNITSIQAVPNLSLPRVTGV